MSSFFNEKLRGVKEGMYELSWHAPTCTKQKECKAFKKNHFYGDIVHQKWNGLILFFLAQTNEIKKALYFKIAF